MPPLPADSIHARACKLKCEKILTRPIKIIFPIEYRKNFRPFLRDKIKTSRNKNFLSAGSLGTV